MTKYSGPTQKSRADARTSFYIGGLMFLLMMQLQHTALAQKSAKSYQNAKSKNSASKKQLPQVQLGFKTGINFTTVDAGESYNLFENIGGAETTYEKDYARKNKPGIQLGFIAAFALNRNITLSVAPLFINQNFQYQTAYGWTNAEEPSNNTTLDFTHRHVLQYIEIPLSVKYHFLNGSFRPYVEGGAYYGSLQSANKTVQSNRSDNATGDIPVVATDEQTIGLEKAFIKSNTGLLAGGGIRYDIGQVSSLMEGSSDLGVITITLGCIYKYGLNQIVDQNNRYSDSRSLYGVYDTFDNMSLRNIEISLGCLFTLKYKNTSK